MPRPAKIQFNVRSAFARQRAHELAKLTGMTATQVVEEALRAYAPPVAPAAPEGLVRDGPFLVKPSSSRIVTLAEAEDALVEVRERDLED